MLLPNQHSHHRHKANTGSGRGGGAHLAELALLHALAHIPAGQPGAAGEAGKVKSAHSTRRCQPALNGSQADNSTKNRSTTRPAPPPNPFSRPPPLLLPLRTHQWTKARLAYMRSNLWSRREKTSAMAVELEIMHTARCTLARSPPGTTVGGW